MSAVPGYFPILLHVLPPSTNLSMSKPYEVIRLLQKACLIKDGAKRGDLISLRQRVAVLREELLRIDGSVKIDGWDCVLSYLDRKVQQFFASPSEFRREVIVPIFGENPPLLINFGNASRDLEGYIDCRAQLLSPDSDGLRRAYLVGVLATSVLDGFKQWGEELLRNIEAELVENNRQFQLFAVNVTYGFLPIVSARDGVSKNQGEYRGLLRKKKFLERDIEQLKTFIDFLNQESDSSLVGEGLLTEKEISSLKSMKREYLPSLWHKNNMLLFCEMAYAKLYHGALPSPKTGYRWLLSQIKRKPLRQQAEAFRAAHEVLCIYNSLSKKRIQKLMKIYSAGEIPISASERKDILDFLKVLKANRAFIDHTCLPLKERFPQQFYLINLLGDRETVLNFIASRERECFGTRYCLPEERIAEILRQEWLDANQALGDEKFPLPSTARADLMSGFRAGILEMVLPSLAVSESSQEKEVITCLPNESLLNLYTLLRDRVTSDRMMIFCLLSLHTQLITNSIHAEFLRQVNSGEDEFRQDFVATRALSSAIPLQIENGKVKVKLPLGVVRVIDEEGEVKYYMLNESIQELNVGKATYAEFLQRNRIDVFEKISETSFIIRYFNLGYTMGLLLEDITAERVICGYDVQFTVDTSDGTIKCSSLEVTRHPLRVSRHLT